MTTNTATENTFGMENWLDAGLTPLQVREALAKSRVDLLWSQPFWAQLALNLNLVDATNTKWCHTMATDGRNLYYNNKFVNHLLASDDKEGMYQVDFVICHEICHCVLDHLGRRGERDPNKWNMAVDYATNWMLVNSRVGKMPSIGLYNEKFDDKWDSEHIYDYIVQNPDEFPYSQMDIHLELTGGSDETGEPRLTVQDLENLRADIKIQVIQAAKNNPGHVPSGIERMVKAILNPQLDWRALVALEMKSLIKADYTFLNPSRRSYGLGVILPGQSTDETIDVVLSMDLSGSVDDRMLQDYISEVYGLITEFVDYRIHMLSFDAQVHSYKLFTPHNIDELLGYAWHGGGGTMFMPVWDWMKKNDIRPNLHIMMTDMGSGDGYGDPDYCKTIFIDYANSGIIAPHGKTVPYKPKKI